MPGIFEELAGFLQVALKLRPLDAVLHVVVDPVARRLSQAAGFRLIESTAVNSQAHRLAHPFVVEGVLGIVETRELQPPGARQHRGEHDAGDFANCFDQFPGHEIDNVCLAAFQHGHPGRRFWHGNHDELLHMHGPIIVRKGLQFHPHAGLLPHQLVRPCPNGLLLEAVSPNLLIILRRDDPSGAADVRRPEDDREV